MKCFYICIIIALCSLQVFGQEECSAIASWGFDEVEGSVAHEEINSLAFTVRNNYNRPERVPGVKDLALRLDGFSTWVHGPFSLPESLRAFSISAWYATEAYPTETAAIINQQQNSGGFGLELTKYGILRFVIRTATSTHEVALDTALPKYSWNHIVAIADLDSKIIKIVLNDSIEKEISLSGIDAFEWSESELKIAIHNQTNIFAGLWPTGVLNGLIDEVEIFGCALDSSEIHSIYSTNLPAVLPDLSIPTTRHADDPNRPRYHAMPPTSWTNEPYGLIYHKGSYHLFYQKNPNGPYHAHMHWGHIRSSDLVTWEDMPIALAPEPGWDQHGIWSGHVVKNDSGNVVAFYTGVDGVKAGIGIAYPDEELKVWTKEPTNPLIPNPPSTYNHMDFRDPFIWKYGDTWFMIVGSGIHHVGGILMTYTSDDMLTWENATPLFYDSYENSGRFWEMPAFFKITETKYVLLVNTVPWEGVPAETIYWIGEWEGGRFHPDQEKPKKFDLINGPLLAPSITKDEAGRVIAIGIIPETRSSEDQNKAGWTHTYSLPRQLRLMADGNLGQIPHPNLCRLRDEATHVENRSVTTGSKLNLPEVSGNQIEMKFEIKADSAAKFSIHFSKNADERELTALHFNLEDNVVTLDRSKSSLLNTAKDIREAKYIFDHRENIHVNIFIDHSVVEVFIDNIVSFSSRIYPSLAESNKVDLVVASKSVEIVTLDAWQMKNMDSASSTLVCEPDPQSLPDSLRKESVDPILGVQDESALNGLELYPNPARNLIEIHYSKKSNASQFDLQIFSLTGQRVSNIEINNTGRQVDISRLNPGVYYAQFSNEWQTRIVKFIVVR